MLVLPLPYKLFIVNLCKVSKKNTFESNASCSIIIRTLYCELATWPNYLAGGSAKIDKKFPSCGEEELDTYLEYIFTLILQALRCSKNVLWY